MAHGEAGDKLIVVVDEAWRIFSHLGIGEWLQDSFKHSRAYGVQNVIVMHRLSDLRAAGAEGSRDDEGGEHVAEQASDDHARQQQHDRIGLARRGELGARARPSSPTIVGNT